MELKLIKLIFVLFFIILISGCVSQPKITGGDYVMAAPQVFDGIKVLSSEQDAKELLVSNSEKIMNGVIEFYSSHPNAIENERYASFRRIIDSVGDDWQFDRSDVKLRGCCAGYFWTGNDSEKYVATVLSSGTGTKEKIICNDPLEQPAVNEQTGTTNCGSGIKEKKTLNLNSILMFIIDKNGKVYFAGAYPNQS
ncbi:hypothetical protein HYS31_07730 [Candidatus Woesearchaeota archaeon]|nr:hypothetical protein [Candidatus Woesearchaeota archaeon]